MYSLLEIPKKYLLPAKRKVSYMSAKLRMSVLHRIFSNHLHSYGIKYKHRGMRQCHVFLNCCHVEKMTHIGPTASTQASIVGKDQEAQPLNNNITGGSTQSSPTSGLLALTPPNLSRWFLGPDCSLCKASINRLPSFTSELDS